MPIRDKAWTVLAIAVVTTIALVAASAPAGVVSIDCGNAGGVSTGDTTTEPVAEGEPQTIPLNADGLIFTGQTGDWAYDPLTPTGNYSTTVSVGEVTWTFNPGEAEIVSAWSAGGTDPLRRDYHCIIEPSRYSGPVTWELTGLTPNRSYDMILFSLYPGQQGKFSIPGHDAGNGPGEAVTNDSEGDGNFTGVLADGTGTISGLFDVHASGVWATLAGVQFQESPTSVLPGDFNRDDQVDQGDLSLLLSNWGLDAGEPPDGWHEEAWDPAVDQEELSALLANWGAGTGAAAVPEPATFVLVGIGLLGLIGFSQRKR